MQIYEFSMGGGVESVFTVIHERCENKIFINTVESNLNTIT